MLMRIEYVNLKSTGVGAMTERPVPAIVQKKIARFVSPDLFGSEIGYLTTSNKGPVAIRNFRICSKG